ncbi:MAG: flagellar biosynthesis regulator FlaF [Caulobacteraceae bacterium]
MSLQAYQQAAQRAEQPRDLEYRLFAQVTRALMEAEKAPIDDLKTRINALDWNRRVWSALATDCSSPQNGLPNALRASIISLSIWVAKHSSAVMRKEETFEALIDVNRLIMQGLNSGAQASASAA